MNLDSLLEHTRELRRQGKGRQVQDILLGLTAYQGTALATAQIGIEMNFAGLYRPAEALLDRALARNEITGFSLYIARNELCAAKYATGKFHQAQDLFRATRRMRDDLVAHLYNWSSDPAFLNQIRSKFLGDQPVAGKIILVAHEGGFGDLVMHSRYLGALKDDGASAILVETPPAAAGMFAQDSSITEIFDIREGLVRADHITWNFDLFARYQHDPIPNPPAGAMRLFPHDLALPESVQAQLDRGRGKFRIGLLTASTSRVRHDPFRAIPVAALAPLLKAARGREFSFYGLNNNPADALAGDAHGIADIGPALTSFAQTAAVLRQLDLLISIDTGPAHLAAALNRPVWLLLSAAGDSRWLDDPHRTPWYQTMRLYRQKLLGDWTDPVQAMLADLPRAP